MNRILETDSHFTIIFLVASLFSVLVSVDSYGSTKDRMFIDRLYDQTNKEETQLANVFDSYMTRFGSITCFPILPIDRQRNSMVKKEDGRYYIKDILYIPQEHAERLRY